MLRALAGLITLFCAGGCSNDQPRLRSVVINESTDLTACSENIPVSASAIASGQTSVPLCSSQMVSVSQSLPSAILISIAASSARHFSAYAFIAPSACSAISTCPLPWFRHTQNSSRIWLPWFAGSGLSAGILWSEPGRLSFVLSPKGSRTGPDFGNPAETALAPSRVMGIQWRRVDSNHRPEAYEASELPLLYGAETTFVSQQHDARKVSPRSNIPESARVANGGLS